MQETMHDPRAWTACMNHAAAAWFMQSNSCNRVYEEKTRAWFMQCNPCKRKKNAKYATHAPYATDGFAATDAKKTETSRLCEPNRSQKGIRAAPEGDSKRTPTKKRRNIESIHHLQYFGHIGRPLKHSSWESLGTKNRWQKMSRNRARQKYKTLKLKLPPGGHVPSLII